MVDSVTFGPAKPVPARLSPTATSGGRSAGKGANISSTTAHSLSLASALAQKGPPFDADKIASLRAAIASGSYVDADRAQDNDADELDSLTLEQHWASGVDDLFGEWA